MNINLIKNVSKAFSSNSKSRFLNFARIVAFISVATGSMALIISLSVLEGFDKQLHKNAVKFTSHVTLTTSNKQEIKDYHIAIDYIHDRFKDYKSIYPIVEKEALAGNTNLAEGVLISGVESRYFEKDLALTQNGKRFEFASDTSNEVIIGKRLADKLNLAVGSKIVLYSLNENSNINNLAPRARAFKIKALYETGMTQYDDVKIYMPIVAAARFLGMRDYSANKFEIMLKDINKAPEFAKDMERRMGAPFYTMTVFDIHRSIFSWIELQKEPIPIVLGLISLVAVLNIITALLITVVEKTSQIGILRALGMKGKDICLIFLSQGLFIGLFGTAAGLGISYLFSILQQKFGFISLDGTIYFLDKLPVEIVVAHYLSVGLISVLLAVLGAVLPSIAAVKVTPIKALRFK